MKLFSQPIRIGTALAALAFAASAPAETLLLQNAVVHTVTGPTYTNGGALLDGGKISQVFEGAPPASVHADKTIDLKGKHLYPGLIALDTALGLIELEAVRATADMAETGDYTPDVQSWIAVNPDSKLLPTTRANGIAYFEPAPQGGIVGGQSALVSMDGWTTEQMAFKKPAALHVYWPEMNLNTAPRMRRRDPSGGGGPGSLGDQAREHRLKLRELSDFFVEAKAYAHAKDAATNGGAAMPEKIPAWEAMLPYVRGELPIIVHADDLRQIKTAVAWAATNHYNICIAGARDAGMAAGLLASNKITVIYENEFSQPSRDTEPYDVHYAEPETLRKAGVKVIFGSGPSAMDASFARNLPYHAAQAVAFGMPAADALKGLTLYPAELLGVSDHLGSIEAGKDATLFVSSGDILDIRCGVERMWIAGKEISLASRHTRLYEKYRNRPH